MIRPTDRIITTHAGALTRSEGLRELVRARAFGDPYDARELSARLAEEVRDVVRRQVAIGLDSVNDGELSKVNFTHYVRERLGGLEVRAAKAGEAPPALVIHAREARSFPAYFAPGGAGENLFHDGHRHGRSTLPGASADRHFILESFRTRMLLTVPGIGRIAQSASDEEEYNMHVVFGMVIDDIY